MALLFSNFLIGRHCNFVSDLIGRDNIERPHPLSFCSLIQLTGTDLTLKCQFSVWLRGETDKML